MQPTAQHEGVLAFEEGVPRRLETEAGNQGPAIRIPPADFPDRGFEHAVFGLDRTQSPPDLVSRLEHLDVVSRANEALSTDEAGESPADDHDRGHQTGPGTTGSWATDGVS